MTQSLSQTLPFSYIFFPESFSPNHEAPLQLITLFTRILHSCSAHMLPWCQATWQLCRLPKPVCHVKHFNRHTELASNSACSLAVPALPDMWKFDTVCFHWSANTFRSPICTKDIFSPRKLSNSCLILPADFISLLSSLIGCKLPQQVHSSSQSNKV